MNRNILCFFMALLVVQISQVHSSYLLKTPLFKGCLNLLYMGARGTAKTVCYGMPTLFGLGKLSQHIIKEKQDQMENLIFVYPFDKQAQKENESLKEEIQWYALQTMPNEWKECNSEQELLQKISNKKEKALEELKDIIGFKEPLPSWQERSAESKKYYVDRAK